MNWLRRTGLTLSALATLAPTAHVLELPNKFAFDAALWLAVQQHLYRGWGPLLGCPAEIGALAVSLGLAYRRRNSGVGMWLTLAASAGYAGMLGVFFVLNLPVNIAVASWTPATLPPDWASYRLQWELEHLIALLLAIFSLGALLWAAARDRRG